MKKVLTVVVTCLAAFFFICGTPYAGQREKFGEDPRHKNANRVTFKPSTETIKWKMVMPWSKGILFYDMARRGSKRGIVTMCIGGGMGFAYLLEMA